MAVARASRCPTTRSRCSSSLLAGLSGDLGVTLRALLSDDEVVAVEHRLRRLLSHRRAPDAQRGLAGDPLAAVLAQPLRAR